MDFHKLLGKIRELEQPTQQKAVVTESVVMEKAVSKSQQQAAGAALAAKRSDGKAKGASKEMMKMSTKELEKIASTKHKGLPKKKTDESQVLDTDEEIAEVFDADAKVGDKKKTSSGVATKTATGLRHEKSYKGDDNDEEDKPKAKKKVKEEMKVGDKKSSSTGGTIEKTKTGVKHTAGKNYGGKAAEDEDKKKVKEGAKPDFLDIDKDGDKKEPMKKAVADKKGGKPQKGVNPFAKKAVKESVEPKLTFKDCIKLVRESGGQQQIDPLDKELFAWAQRVAQNKFNESVKQDAFAGLTYERMGGRFALHDVLSENKK
jgi:hypothetical protein